jgi:hypothetical protein
LTSLTLYCKVLLVNNKWRSLFSGKVAPCFPWTDGYALTAPERELVKISLPQFQLGEGSEGKGLKARAKASPLAIDDPDFLPTLDLFIREEQRHSSDLGRFLDREQIPRLKHHWVDGIFRRVRKLAGLELSLWVLVTAEIIAVPYYAALSEATASPLLKAICTRILDDEFDHLRYQSDNLSRLRSLRRFHGDFGEWVARGFLMLGALLIVWKDHHRLFRAGGYSWTRFRCECEILLDDVSSGAIAGSPSRRLQWS